MLNRERDNWIGQFINGKLKPLLGSDGRDRNAATLAKLRRCAGKHPTSALEQAGGLFSQVPDENRPRACFENTLDSAALIASLFALWHQGDRPIGEKPPPSFGASFKVMADAERHRSGLKQSDPVPNVERRFASLLDSHPDDLPKRLRHAVSLLKSKNIAIHWSNLLNDLLRWHTENRSVQRRWAYDFWVGRNFKENDTQQDADGETMAATSTFNPVSEETDDDS